MANPLLMYAPYAPGAPPFAPINECIDCVTDWVTRYLGERTFTYTHNGNQIWSGPTKPTIRGLVSNYINGIIGAYNTYYGTRSALDYRSIYNQLLDSYNSLDYNTLEERWTAFKNNPQNKVFIEQRWNDNRSPNSAWKNDIITQAAYRADHLLFQNVGTNNYFGLSKFLETIAHPNILYNWSPEPVSNNQYSNQVNGVLREYIRCFLRLLKALFPDYPDFNGGSKRKNKNKKTKKHKNKKSKKINKGKRSRRY